MADSLAQAALYVSVLLPLVASLWLARRLFVMRGQLAAQMLDGARLVRDLETSATEYARLEGLVAKEGERRQRAEASARLAGLSEQSVQRSIEELLDALDRKLSVVLDRVLEDARNAQRRDLSSPERRRLLERLARDGESANDVLGELVDLRRLHRGELALDRTNVQLAEMLQRVREWAEPLTEARSQRFELEVQGRLPARIETDPRRLVRILRLVIRRAMEPEGVGRVVLLVQREQTEALEGLRFTVVREGEMRAPEPESERDEKLQAIACDLDLPVSVAVSIAEELGGGLVSDRGEQGGIRYVLRITCRASSIGQGANSRVNEGQELLTQTNRRLTSALLAGKRILVADDAEESLRVIEWVLGRAGAECTLVGNGQEAIERAHFAQVHGTPYDLVLLDLEMPVLDGYETVVELRTKGCASPVLALTGHTSDEVRTRCAELGFDDFLCKPIDRNVLLRQLAARFYPVPVKRDEDASLAAGAGEPSQPPAPLPSPAATAGTSRIKSLFAGDEDMAELIDWFVQEIEKDVERIERALERGENGELASIAHQLKGSAGSYGFPLVSEQAERLEGAIARRADAACLQQEARTLIDLCQRIEGS